MRLLFVEDDTDVAAPLIAALKSLNGGYRISRAATMQGALKLVEQSRFDAALVDLTLPDASNCDIALALRRAAPELPVVALTGCDFESVALPLTRVGVQDYLQKGADSINRIHQTLHLAVERERQRAALHRRASHDQLTGVLNRGALEAQVAKAIAHSLRSGSLGALVLIDVDDFKQINDTLGHQIGDIVLREIAFRLRSMIRIGDSIGRFGGDEFIALIEGLNDIHDAAQVAAKLHSASCCTVTASQHQIPVTTSVGASVFPIEGTTSAELLHIADKAMYQAKRNGKASLRQRLTMQ